MTHPCQSNSHATYDFELTGRTSSASSSTAVAAASSPSQKSTVCGLSRLLASSATTEKFSSSVEESGSALRHDRPGKEFSRYSSLSSSIKRDQGYQSPASVLQGPICCISNSGISSGVMSWSPPMRIGDNVSSIRSSTGGLFNRFVRHALSSYVDYDSTYFQVKDAMDSTAMVDELTFSMEDTSVDLDVAPFAEDLLSDAQNRHKIFHDDFVIKALYETEKAHR